jgi:hypothetical protein
MPEPLASGLHTAKMRDLVPGLAGKTPGRLTELARTCPAARLPLLTLTPVVITCEHALTSDTGTNIWRTGQHTSAIRPAAGSYLAFLSSLGYQLSSIGQAVAEGTIWEGEPAPAPAEPDITGSG